MLSQSASHRSLADKHLTTSVRFYFLSNGKGRQQNRHTAHQLSPRSANDISSNQFSLTNTTTRPSELSERGAGQRLKLSDEHLQVQRRRLNSDKKSVHLRTTLLAFLIHLAINPSREDINTNKHWRIDNPHIL